MLLGLLIQWRNVSLPYPTNHVAKAIAAVKTFTPLSFVRTISSLSDPGSLINEQKFLLGLSVVEAMILSGVYAATDVTDVSTAACLDLDGFLSRRSHRDLEPDP